MRIRRSDYRAFAEVKNPTTGLNDFYRTNYPDGYSQKQESRQGAVTEVQRIFQTYFFPEMNGSSSGTS